MSLLKKIQHRVGVALSPAEHYERAFTQGVLLGPNSFATAAELFERAATRAQRAGENALHHCAHANALLYQFLSGAPPQVLSPLHEALESLSEIEHVGSRFDRVSAEFIRGEVAGRLAEHAITTRHPHAHADRARLHHSAAHYFHALGERALQTYTHRPDGMTLDRGDLRGFFHEGMARFHEALDQARHDPDGAADQMGNALVALHQTSAVVQQNEAERWLEGLRIRRSCWSCGREFSGANLHHHALSATVHAYVGKVLRQAGHDLTSVDLCNQTVVMCTTCKSAICMLADAQALLRVQELRTEVESQVAGLQRQLTALDQRVAALALSRIS